MDNAKNKDYSHTEEGFNPRCRARSAVAKDIKKAHELIEAGFEYVTEMDGVKIFRKMK